MSNIFLMFLAMLIAPSAAFVISSHNAWFCDVEAKRSIYSYSPTRDQNATNACIYVCIYMYYIYAWYIYIWGYASWRGRGQSRGVCVTGSTCQQRKRHPTPSEVWRWAAYATNARRCVCMYMRVFIYIHTYTYICRYIYINMYRHIYTYICIYLYI